MRRDALEDLLVDDVPGCCIGLVVDGEPAGISCHGRCTTAGDAITSDTLWEAASLSKPIVAFATLAAAVDDPDFLSRPLVTAPSAIDAVDDPRWGDLTVRHLMLHTTGLPNWRPDGELLRFESNPGTPGYSGEGYELMLAELCARSNTSPGTLLDGHLRGLGMLRSSFTPADGARAAVAIGHDTTGARLSKSWPDEPRAAGSLHTTAHDFVEFLAAVVRPGRLVGATQRAAMERLTARELEILPGAGRTPGFSFVHTAAGDVLSQHGDNPGFKHVAVARPATADALVVLTNSDHGQHLYRDVVSRIFAVDVW